MALSDFLDALTGSRTHTEGEKSSYADIAKQAQGLVNLHTAESKPCEMLNDKTTLSPGLMPWSPSPMSSLVPGTSWPKTIPDCTPVRPSYI
jgi:hypothetical protein